MWVSLAECTPTSGSTTQPEWQCTLASLATLARNPDGVLARLPASHCSWSEPASSGHGHRDRTAPTRSGPISRGADRGDRSLLAALCRSASAPFWFDWGL